MENLNIIEDFRNNLNHIVNFHERGIISDSYIETLVSFISNFNNICKINKIKKFNQINQFNQNNFQFNQNNFQFNQNNNFINLNDDYSTIEIKSGIETIKIDNDIWTNKEVDYDIYKSENGNKIKNNYINFYNNIIYE